MTLKRYSALSLALALGGITGCASTDASSPSKADESEAPVDGKLDGLSIIDHADLVFGFRLPSRIAVASDGDSLTRSRRAHAWEFELSGEADVRLALDTPGSTSSDLDTVMYLYREQANGNWGRYIRRNDDGSTNSRKPYLSAIDEGGLGAGRYRIVVKGYSSAEQGAFTVNAQCEGAGCVLGAAAPDCFADEEVTFLQDTERYSVADSLPITSSVRPNNLLKSQILLAVGNHAELLGDNVDIDSVADARAYVDPESLEAWNFTDTQTERTFTVVDFSMGDTVVGSVFNAGTTDIVATINDAQIIAVDGEELCR